MLRAVLFRLIKNEEISKKNFDKQLVNRINYIHSLFVKLLFQIMIILLASFFNNQILFKFFNIINNFLISLQFRQLLIIPSNNYYTRLEQIDIPNTPPNTLLPREKEGAS